MNETDTDPRNHDTTRKNREGRKEARKEGKRSCHRQLQRHATERIGTLLCTYTYVRMPSATKNQTKRGRKSCVQRANERAVVRESGSGIVIRGEDTGGVSTTLQGCGGSEDRVDIKGSHRQEGERETALRLRADRRCLHNLAFRRSERALWDVPILEARVAHLVKVCRRASVKRFSALRDGIKMYRWEGPRQDVGELEGEGTKRLCGSSCVLGGDNSLVRGYGHNSSHRVRTPGHTPDLARKRQKQLARRTHQESRCTS